LGRSKIISILEKKSDNPSENADMRNEKGFLKSTP